MKSLYGITPAVMTPFQANSEIDYAALKEHVDFLIEKGVHNLYPNGTVGEALSMTPEERQSVAEKVVEYAAGRVGVFVHVGLLDVRESIDLALHARSVGADGVGAVTPYFYNVSQNDIMDYYRALSAGLPDDFPIYIYNLPCCAVNDILPESVAELAKLPNICGIKNTQGDILRMTTLLRKVPEDFTVIMGEDQALMSALALGAKGAVSGTSNMIPEVFVSMYDAVCAGDLKTAAHCQQQISEVFELMHGSVRTCHIKAALEMRGFRKSYTRAPQQRETTPEELAEFRPGLQEIFRAEGYFG